MTLLIAYLLMYALGILTFWTAFWVFVLWLIHLAWTAQRRTRVSK